MCYLVPYYRLQLDYKDGEIIIGDRTITNDATIKTFEALGATFNFIGIWLKFLCKNYDARCEACTNAMKEMFMQIPQTFEIALTPKQKIQKLMTDIGGG